MVLLSFVVCLSQDPVLPSCVCVFIHVHTQMYLMLTLLKVFEDLGILFSGFFRDSFK